MLKCEMHVDTIYKGWVQEVPKEEGRCTFAAVLKYRSIYLPYVTNVMIELVKLHSGRTKYRTQSTVYKYDGKS